MAAGDGLISMTPTSIAVGSGTASINADGGVDFSAVTSLSLNGVFTSEFDNYRITLSSIASAVADLLLVLRVGGVNATGANYTCEYMYGQGTAVGAQRYSGRTNALGFMAGSTTLQSGGECHMYGPALAQATAWRNVNANSYLSATIADYASTHSLATSYDGFTLTSDAGQTFTGNVHVFGYEE